MDGAWHMKQRQIHYHLARAIVHLNYIAGSLPFSEPAIDWEDSEPPPHHQTMLPPPDHHTHSRHLHIFAHAEHAILIVSLDHISWWRTCPHGVES
jgi:hypothetical protein